MFSSFLFIFAMGLVNADSNITYIDLQQNPGPYIYNGAEVENSEGNPLAAPLADTPFHCLNTVAAIGISALAYDKLKKFDYQNGMKDFGTKDLLSIGIIGVEFQTISSWQGAGPAVISKEVLLSEAEFIITSSVLNIRF
jgi:hypothetical protein